MKYVFTDAEIVCAVGQYLTDRVIKRSVRMEGDLSIRDGKFVLEMEVKEFDPKVPPSTPPFMSPVDG